MFKIRMRFSSIDLLAFVVWERRQKMPRPHAAKALFSYEDPRELQWRLRELRVPNEHITSRIQWTPVSYNEVGVRMKEVPKKQLASLQLS